MDLTSSLHCLACGVEGTEGAHLFPISGARDEFLLLVCTSLKPSVLMPAAAIAALAFFFLSLTASFSFTLGASAAAGFWTGTRGGFGKECSGFGFFSRRGLACWADGGHNCSSWGPGVLGSWPL